MLHDTPKLVAGSEIERDLVAEGKRGATFPLAPVFGFDFKLTEIDQGKNPGLYIFMGGSGWVEQENSLGGSKFYDIGLTIFDRPKSNALVCKHLAVRAFVLGANFDRSMAMASLAATDSYTMEVYVLEVDRVTQRPCGTLSFAAAAEFGVFAGINGNDIPVLRGETLIVKAPEIRDATLRNIDVTFAGTLASTI